MLAIAFDAQLQTRVSAAGQVLTPFQASESLLLAGGPVEKFAFRGQRSESVRDRLHAEVLSGLAAGERLVTAIHRQHAGAGRFRW